MTIQVAGLEGRTALVTGGGSGIGRAVALAFAASGARVGVLARSAYDLDAVQEAITSQGGDAIAIPADVSSAVDVERAVKRLGSVDLLVNCAGVVWPLGPTWDVDLVAWEQALSVNLTGPLRCTRAVLPGMLRNSYGRIVNITSGVATENGLVRANAYSVSKAGLNMLTRNLAAELSGTGVTCNAVRPGVVDTGMQAYLRKGDPQRVGQPLLDRFTGFLTRGELLDPEVPARLVLKVVLSAQTGRVFAIQDEPSLDGD